MDLADRPAPLIEVHDDPASLATVVAGELLNRIADAQAAGNVPHIGLTGGTIADRIHREVARMAPESGVDWGAVVFWFGDERYVASDSPDRNAVQAREAFLDAVGATRVHEVPAADQVPSAEESASSYSSEIRASGAGAFDIVMFGVGPDGHIASLFPHHPGLDAEDAIAIAVHDSPKPPPDRVSLTYEAFERSHVVWFVASGEEKADAVARALADDGDLHATPARGVKGMQETTFFLDHAAASRL
ncbi:6-phosphogluconolactonase [Nocardioides sp. MH1]|uniref:6-phosphogluconolactonase n=1 Tax=Nocardioides sp. MH1 TaxID=3242490 RepID=UPI003520FC20